MLGFHCQKQWSWFFFCARKLFLSFFAMAIFGIKIHNCENLWQKNSMTEHLWVAQQSMTASAAMECFNAVFCCHKMFCHGFFCDRFSPLWILMLKMAKNDKKSFRAHRKKNHWSKILEIFDFFSRMNHYWLFIIQVMVIHL